MSGNNSAATICAFTSAQPGDVSELSEAERATLIISSIQVDGKWIILSRYADSIWCLTGFTSNVKMSKKHLDFESPRVF